MLKTCGKISNFDNISTQVYFFILEASFFFFLSFHCHCNLNVYINNSEMGYTSVKVRCGENQFTFRS